MTHADNRTRTERDTFGPIEVPADRLWGAQTQRSLQNFDISGERQPREIIRALAQVKRAAAIAFINSLCNTPNIWGSYLFYDEPRYVTAFIVFIAATGIAIAFAIGTRFYLARQNKKLDRGDSPGKHGPTEAQLVNGFRYLL